MTHQVQHAKQFGHSAQARPASVGQAGFTLIELMIVVAIVGILASVAIPAYSDYTVRAKVTEAVTAAGAIKTSVADYYYANGELPTSNAEAGIAESTAFSSDVISEITIEPGTSEGVDAGTISIELDPNLASDIESGNKLVFAPFTSNGNISWSCSVSKWGGDFPSKYAPAICRDAGGA
ncbi:pilin [Spiribacter pallidus]|uniref:Pilin n=1 Tax=Spiribacter pallidus TaxID=1987936 RepID=A0ABV3TEH6_9GAMM